MNLTFQDFNALSPFFILLIGALTLLLVEIFHEKTSYKVTASITFVVLLAAIYAALYAPASEHALITPWLKFDQTARFFSVFFLSIGLGVTLLALPFFEKFENRSYQLQSNEYFFLMLASIAGLIMVSSSADFLTLFIGIETLSVSLYIACGYLKHWKGAQESSIKYLLTGAVMAAVLVYGIALMYGAAGTLKYSELLPAFTGLLDGPAKILFLCGAGLIAIGIGFKAALVPFHFWAPDAYEGATNPLTAFMAIATKAGAFVAFIRIFLEALPEFSPLINEGLSFIAYATLIYANFVAMKQFQLRRFFAYSGIAHAALLLLPIIAGTKDAPFAIEFYLVVYALATLGAFAALGFIDDKVEGITIDDLKGLALRSPLIACLFIFSLLTLAGIPPTAGFFAKFYVFKVTYEAGYYGLLIVGLLTTVLSAYTYLRILSRLFMTDTSQQMIYKSYSSALLGAVCVAGIIWISFYPEGILRFVQP